MRRRIFRFCASLGVILILASMTEGCGRRGRLLPPPDPDNPFALPAKPVLSPTAPAATAQGAKPAGATTTAAAPRSDMTKAGLHRKPANPPIVAPKQPFILDPLL